MAASADTQKKNEEMTLNQRINDFIQKNRMGLLISLILLIALLAGFIVYTTVSEKMLETALTETDSFSRRYESLRIEDGGDAPDAVSRLIEIAGLSQEVLSFAAQKSGYASARAYSLLADIHWDQKNWADAEKSWIIAAKESGKSYLAPVSFYNAATAAEEQGNTETAIAHYTSAASFGNLFPSAARAQFSIGRLEESRNGKEAALVAYRNLINNWPDDPVWSNLAQSRILALSE